MSLSDQDVAFMLIDYSPLPGFHLLVALFSAVGTFGWRL